MEPLTREEVFLAKMSGEDISTPEPITRKEEYMDKIADKINAAAAELPVVTGDDEGKILAVNSNGKWDKADAPTELPAVTDTDEGKVLTVNTNGKWVPNKPSETPSFLDSLQDLTKYTEVGSAQKAITADTDVVFTINLDGQMDYTDSFEGVIGVYSFTGPTLYSRYAVYKPSGTSEVLIYPLFIFTRSTVKISASLTGGSDSSTSATAINITVNNSDNCQGIVELYQN